MIPTYRRFKELRDKAIAKLNGYGNLEAQLTDAVCEIDMMHQEEVPDYKWSQVQSITNSCRTHKAVGDEGIYRASINKMSYAEQQALKKAILAL